MADNVAITAGTGTTVAADELTDGVLGSVKVQFVKMMDGTLDSSNKLIVTAAGAAKVDGSAVTQPVSGTVTANAGSGTMAVSAAALPLPTGASTAAKQPALGTAGTPSADVISIQGIASMTAVKVDGSAVTQPVSVAPPTSGGLSTFHLVSAATANATNLKASAGQVFGWYIYNSNAAARKVVFHDTAGTPTAGASVKLALMIPPTSGANVFGEAGIAFSTGIAITTVTGLADSDATAVALNDLVINIFYK